MSEEAEPLAKVPMKEMRADGHGGLTTDNGHYWKIITDLQKNYGMYLIMTFSACNEWLYFHDKRLMPA
jgi:hypothetical protein